MTTDKIESYHPNNKQGGFVNNSSKPYTLNNIQYNTPPPPTTTTNNHGFASEGSPLVSRFDRDYPMESSIEIGDGIHSIVDYRIRDSLNFYSLWGNILCFTQLVLGSFLYFSCGLDSYFILTTIAIVSHTISCSLGLYAIAQKNILLIINYTIYAFLILGVNIAVFILSIMAMKDNYPWFLFISGVVVFIFQSLGLKYMLNLFFLLRALQNREIHTTNIINAPNPTLISHPQQYQVYPGQPQQTQPNQQQYYYTTPLTSNNNNPTYKL